MGWGLTAADVPTPEDHSLTTALIYVLGTVLVALITIGLPLVFRQSKAAESPPAPVLDPKIGETVAVLASKEADDRLTLSMLDRHVDAIGDRVDQLAWRLDDLAAWRAEHKRKHGEQ